MCLTRPAITRNHRNTTFTTPFTVLPQIFTEKPVINQKGVGLVAYPFHMFLFFVSNGIGGILDEREIFNWTCFPVLCSANRNVYRVSGIGSIYYHITIY